MNLESFDLVASLQALPETDPVEINGIQLGGSQRTCNKRCTDGISLQFLDTQCVQHTCR